MNIKNLLCIIFFLLIMTCLTLGVSIAKYLKEIQGPSVTLNITAPTWDNITASSYNNGGFNTLSMITNTRKNLVIRVAPKAGYHERFWIPLKGLEVGKYYKLYFTENKTYVSSTNGSKSYENDSNTYIYGCTVLSNIDWAKTTSGNVFAEDKYNEGYYWKEDFLDKNYSQYQYNDVCLTFKATAETMYWLWDFANIANYITLDFGLSNISLEKITYPTSGPYIEFTNLTFNNWSMPEITEDSEVKEEYIKDTYITGATENSLDLRVETGIGWEYFNIPIKGLTAGQWYTIDYKELTTNCVINDTNCYGSIVQNQKQTTSSQIISSSTSGYGFDIIKSSQINKTNTRQINFQATADTMYWVWQCGGITNYDWARIRLSDVKISETTAPN